MLKVLYSYAYIGWIVVPPVAHYLITALMANVQPRHQSHFPQENGFIHLI